MCNDAWCFLIYSVASQSTAKASTQTNRKQCFSKGRIPRTLDCSLRIDLGDDVDEKPYFCSKIEIMQRGTYSCVAVST